MTHPLCDKYVTYEKYVFINVNPTILPCNTGVGTKTARVAGAAREMALTDDVTIRGRWRHTLRSWASLCQLWGNITNKLNLKSDTPGHFCGVVWFVLLCVIRVWNLKIKRQHSDWKRRRHFSTVKVKINTDFIIRYFCGRKMNAGFSVSFDLLDQRMHFEWFCPLMIKVFISDNIWTNYFGI